MPDRSGPSAQPYRGELRVDRRVLEIPPGNGLGFGFAGRLADEWCAVEHEVPVVEVTEQHPLPRHQAGEQNRPAGVSAMVDEVAPARSPPQPQRTGPGGGQSLVHLGVHERVYVRPVRVRPGRITDEDAAALQCLEGFGRLDRVQQEVRRGEVESQLARRHRISWSCGPKLQGGTALSRLPAVPVRRG